ncbi:MAG: ETC complex I subunit [Geminicoccaceae bacterium]|nr:ETC complex I subunit [Geminicoccaceae bacterium]
MKVRIHKHAKPATQSGRRRTHDWHVEFEPEHAQHPDRLMGWIGGGETQRQVSLRFPTREAAIAYCEREGIAYQVYEPNERIVRPKAYAENFIKRV